MAKNTDFTNFANLRPNYFPGQYLLEDDFEIQHKYLSDRQLYHNQSLHLPGIIEGLEVVVIQNSKSVQVKAGAAIDSNGNLIILKEDTTFSDFKNLTDGELYIQYFQSQQNQQQKDIADSYTRWVEKSLLGFASPSPQNSVKLAKLTIKDTITLDPNLREYSGLALPTSNSNSLTLRSGGNANPNLAVLTGSLKIDGDLTANGNGKSAFAGSLIVNGNIGIGTTDPGNYKLNVQGDQYNSGSLTINGNVIGKNLSLAADNNKRGTLFLAATGDYNHALYNNLSNVDNEGTWDGAKWNVLSGLNIRVGSGTSKTTALYINNIGNVGIGTNSPGDYKLNVQGNQYIKGSLTIQDGKVSVNGNQQIVFTDTDTTNNLKLQLWTGYGLGINSSTLFYAANGNHSWRDNQNNERMLLTTGADGGLTVKGTGTSNFAGNLTVGGAISGTIDTKNITSGILSVDRIPNLSADKITTGTMAGNLTVTGSLSVGVSLGSTTNIDLSGHVQLKEYAQQNIAFLQARDDSSNRDIGLRIRTQMKGNTQKSLVEAVTITPSGEIQGKVWYSDEYVWQNGQAPTKMGHSSKCVAFLTFVQGKFAGGGEQVYTYIDKNDGYWYLSGAQGSAGAGVMAKARCIGSPS